MGVRRLPDPRMPRPRTTPPVEVNGSAKQPLGMPAADFLRAYWQKKPLLIRNALPGFVSPTEPEALAGLACEDAALSRLVRHEREPDARALRHGPFPGAEFTCPGRRRTG